MKKEDSVENERPQIKVPPMCDTHRSLLVHQAGYTEKDSWRVLEIAAQIALFQATTADPRTHIKIGEDITKISELGCLACLKPDSFGSIVEVAKLKDIGKIKALGEKWVSEGSKK